jgi:hypothetical protein
MDTLQNNDPNYQAPRTEVSHHETGWRVMGEKLYTDLNILIKREIALVRAEFSEKIFDIRKGAVAMGIGIALIFLSIFALMATFILVLGMFIPLWSAALGVTVLFAVIGYALYKGGKQKLDIEELKPHHSIEAVNEMKKIVKENYYEFKSGTKH